MNDLVIAETDFLVASAKIAAVTLDGVRLFKDVPREKLVSWISFWQQHDYLFLQDALTPEAVSLLRQQVTFENMAFADDPRQFHRAHNDGSCHPFINRFLAASKNYYSAILSAEIAPTYAFAMRYIKNSDMEPHYDDFGNSISSTVCYHFTPEHLNNPIYLDRARFENPYPRRVTIKDRRGIPVENVVELHLRAGDVAIFRGRNHLHWRDFVSDEMDYRALLLHFTDYKYKGMLFTGSDQLAQIDPALLDFESYDDFRQRYVMYFNTGKRSWI